MKYIIDLIDDVRASIGNDANYILNVALLKEDKNDTSKLIYAGEATLTDYTLDDTKQELLFSIDGDAEPITVGELIPFLLTEDMKVMMYRIIVNINKQYSDVEIVGFGKNEEIKSYILFIKL